jgi:hypothetical protein
MSTIISFNGRTLEDLGLEWSKPPNYDAALPQHSATSRGGRMGSNLREEGTVAPGTWEIEVMIPPLLSGHEAIRQDLRGWLQGMVEIEQTDRPGLVLTGKLSRDPSTVFAPTSGFGYIEAEAWRVETLSFITPSPLWYDKYVRWLHVPAEAAVSVSDLGSRTAWLELIVPGAATDFWAEYLGPSGHSLAALITTGTVSSGEYLRVVMSTSRVYHNPGSGEVSAMSWLQGDYGGFFAMDSGDGVPLMRTSHACTMKYRRAFG